MNKKNFIALTLSISVIFLESVCILQAQEAPITQNLKSIFSFSFPKFYNTPNSSIIEPTPEHINNTTPHNIPHIKVVDGKVVFENINQESNTFKNSALSYLTARNFLNFSLVGATCYIGYKGYQHTQKFNAANREINQLFEKQKELDKNLNTEIQRLKQEAENNANNTDILTNTIQEQTQKTNSLAQKINPIKTSLCNALSTSNSIASNQKIQYLLLEQINMNKNFATNQLNETKNNVEKLKASMEQNNQEITENLKNYSLKITQQNEEINNINNLIAKSNSSEKEIANNLSILTNITNEENPEYKEFIRDLVEKYIATENFNQTIADID